MSDENGVSPKRLSYRLPEVAAPSLDDLRVQIAASVPPTGDQLLERLHSRLRAAAPRRERKAEEPIGSGDEVECDIVTVVAGQIVPGGIKASARLEVRDFVHLPGLLEQLLLMTTFSAKTFDLVLPEGYPVAEVAGQPATVYLEARRVFQVDQPPLDDLTALRAAGLGDSLEEALENVAAEIDAEQGQELLVEATQTVLAALASRVTETIPAAAVDEELRQTWQRTEGALLLQKRFPGEMVAQAESDFLTNHALREQAEQRIKIGLALGALVEQEGIAPSAETMDMLLQTAADEVGTTYDQAKASLSQEPVYAAGAGQTALYLNAVEFVMSRAVVEVIDPPENAVDAGPHRDPLLS